MQIAYQNRHLLALLATLMAGLVILVAILSDRSLGLWTELGRELQVVQRDLHRQLAMAMRAVQNEGATAAWALVVLSFLYGVFHAAGPGHGKVVISTYLLTQESQLRRGILLSLVSSLCQGFTAIVAVSATAGVLGLTLRQAQGTATDLETVSYGLVAMLGVLLVVSRVRRLLQSRPFSTRRGRKKLPQLSFGTQHARQDDCRDCSHTHGPSLRDLEAPLSWKGLAGIVASIGIRPCTGAVLVLLLAFSLDLRWAGIIAVVAMSLGTAITVSALAMLSVYARKGALRLVARMPDRAGRITVALNVVGVLGGLVILVAGLLMLQAALTVPANPFG